MALAPSSDVDVLFSSSWYFLSLDVLPHVLSTLTSSASLCWLLPTAKEVSLTKAESGSSLLALGAWGSPLQ